MIYTVTFNPSLDYILDLTEFERNQVNRTTGEKILPGGKGNQRIHCTAESRYR